MGRPFQRDPWCVSVTALRRCKQGDSYASRERAVCFTRFALAAEWKLRWSKAWFWMGGDATGTTRAAAPPGSRRYAELSTYTREARGHHRDGPRMSLSDCPGRCRTSPPAVLWSVHLHSTERRPNALTVKGEGWGTRVPHGVSCTQTFLPSHRRAAAWPLGRCTAGQYSAWQ